MLLRGGYSIIDVATQNFIHTLFILGLPFSDGFLGFNKNYLVFIDGIQGVDDSKNLFVFKIVKNNKVKGNFFY